MTDRELRELQQKFVTTKYEKPHCEKCELISHEELKRRFPVLSFNLPEAVAEGWVPLNNVFAYVRYCETCAAIPDRFYDWVGDVPFEVFRDWAISPDGPVSVESLRSV